MASAPATANSGGGGYNRPLLGAIVSGLGSLGQGIVNMVQSRKNTRRTNRANMQLAEYSYDKDLEMWERNNRYNTPEAQMQRLEAAGLNKNLVYGTGNVAGNTSGQIPKFSTPRMDYMGQQPIDTVGAANVLQSYQDMRLKEAQIDNVKAQAVYTGQRTSSELIKGSNYLTDGQKKALELSTARQLQATHIQAGQTNLELLKQKLTTEQRKQIAIDLKNDHQKIMNRWAEKGVVPGDEAWMRAAIEFLDSIGENSDYMRKSLEKIKVAPPGKYVPGSYEKAFPKEKKDIDNLAPFKFWK